MRESISKLPVLTVKGSFKEMGEKHGRLMSKKITELYRIRTELLLKETNKSFSYIQSIAKQSWLNVCDTVPDIAEEIEATAFYANIHNWQLMIAGAYTDISDVLAANLECASECTVGVIPQLSRLLGTWDSHYTALDSALILRRVPNNNVCTLSLTTAGWPVQFGLNSDGLAFGITNLTPSKINPKGIPYIAAIANAALMSNVDNSILWLKSQSFMSGHSYILTDATKSAILETTAESISVKIVDDFCVQTNHYVSDIDNNIKYKYLEGSKKRQIEVLEEIDSSVHPNDFLAWLNNHPNVLRVPYKKSNILSCAAYTIDAIEKSIWIASAYDYKHGMKKITI